MKTVYILIGLKGSGKTYVGKLIEEKLNIKFLEVESYFLKFAEDYKKVKKDSFKEVWEKIESKISKYLIHNDKIVFESLGTFNSFKGFLNRISKKYNVKLIKINAPPKLCFERIKGRDNTNHVKINEELIKKINKIAEKEKYGFDIIIDNSNISDENILEKFKTIL